MSNFASHETIMCDDKDPPWFKNKIRNLIQEKNNLYNNFCKKVKPRHRKANLNIFKNASKLPLSHPKKSFLFG